MGIGTGDIADSANSLREQQPTYGATRLPRPRRCGAAVCIASGLGVAAIPLLWSAVHVVPGLVAVECLSGVAWAGFEFASLQLLLDGSPDECRVELFSLATAAQGVAQLAGALTGSWVLATFALSYTEVFALSGLLRASALLLVTVPLRPLLRRVPLRALWAFPVSIRAVAGVVARPFVRNRPRADGEVAHRDG